MEENVDKQEKYFIKIEKPHQQSIKIQFFEENVAFLRTGYLKSVL